MTIEINGIEYDVVVHADDCFICPLCEEPVCPVCKTHYAECDCLGPNSYEVSDCERIINYYDAVMLGYIKDARGTTESIH